MMAATIEGPYSQLLALAEAQRQQSPPGKIHPNVIALFLAGNPKAINDGVFKVAVELTVQTEGEFSLPGEEISTASQDGVTLRRLTGLQLLDLLEIPQVLSVNA